MDPFELLYLMGRNGPTAVMALGFSLMFNAVWALCWVAGNSRIGGDR